MWLETVILIETAAAFWLSALNVTLLVRAAAEARKRARRIAAIVLAAICTGHSLEALLFLWVGRVEADGALATGGLLLVRTALVVSMASTSLLLVRGLSPRR